MTSAEYARVHRAATAAAQAWQSHRDQCEYCQRHRATERRCATGTELWGLVTESRTLLRHLHQ